MKTAEEVIQLIQELPEDERKKVKEFVSASEDDFLEENYSPDDVAKLDQIQDDLEKGINSSGIFTNMQDAIAYLNQSCKKSE